MVGLMGYERTARVLGILGMVVMALLILTNATWACESDDC
jgi:hypothetical protein